MLLVTNIDGFEFLNMQLSNVTFNTSFRKTFGVLKVAALSMKEQLLNTKGKFTERMSSAF